jgi:ribosomal protein S18 acetylase RimI-like enzyme
MTTVLVRRAEAGDEGRLAQLIAHVHEMHVADQPRVFKPLAPDVAERWFAETLAKPSTFIWLAEQDGAALGYALAFARESAETVFCYARRWYDLDQIAVAPGARERGVARQLVQAVLQAARADGAASVDLATWAFNQRAQSAFQRLGFTPKMLRFWQPG